MNEKISELKKQLETWVSEESGMTTTIELGLFEYGIGELGLSEADVQKFIDEAKIKELRKGCNGCSDCERVTCPPWEIG